jgi:hypothetical protein
MRTLEKVAIKTPGVNGLAKNKSAACGPIAPAGADALPDVRIIGSAE